MRFTLNAVLMFALFFFTLGMPAFGQNPNLFETQPAAAHAGHNDAPLTDAQKAAGEKESIFWNTMKVGQVCSHGTAAILGLTGKDAEEWTVLARKYNKAVNDATEQLFLDASSKLNPKQMELLKAWFAIGWNTQINALLYGKDLDKLEGAQIDSVKKMQKK